MSTAPGVKEILTRPYWDSAQVSAGTDVGSTMFQVPKGSGTSIWGSGAKKLYDTNMIAAGSFPKGYNYEIFTIQFIPDVAISVLDARILLFGSILELSVQDISRYQSPLVLCNAGGGLSGALNIVAASQTANTQVTTNGTPSAKQVNAFEDPIVIEATEAVSVQLTFPVLTGITANTKFWVLFNGRLTRGA